MFRGYRNIGLAFGLVLAMCYTIGGSASAQPGTQNQQTPEKAYHAAPSIAGEIERLNATVKSAIANPESVEDKKNAKDSLQAAKESANWAKWSFIVSVASCVVSAAGLGFLLWTITLTRIQAREAVKGTKIALSTNRPWVVVNTNYEATISKENGPALSLEVTVKNIGATPAIAVFNQCRVVDVSTFKNESAYAAIDTKHPEMFIVLFPNEHRTISRCIIISDEFLADDKINNLGVLVSAFYRNEPDAELKVTPVLHRLFLNFESNEDGVVEYIRDSLVWGKAGLASEFREGIHPT